MQLALPTLISRGMVLQYGIPAPLWGHAAPGAFITVRFLDKTYHTEADAKGAWLVTLAPAGPGGPYTMHIACEDDKTPGNDSITVDDIYVGEVWLCSGQSNMELPLARLRDEYPDEWTPPVNALIRQFHVNITWNFASPQEELAGGSWVPASESSLETFSGTAWFFAKKRYEQYRIPIGLILSAAGGSPVEAWMSKESLKAFPHLLAQGEQYADTAFMNQTIARSDAAQIAWLDNLNQSDCGLTSGAEWFRSDTADSDWHELTLPGSFTGPGLAEFCGVVWLRRTFCVPPELDGRAAKIWLGTITDADTVYINGVEIGNITYRYPPRKYRIPQGLLHAGDNQITVRVICNTGEGAITEGKPFRIFCAYGAIELGGTWKYKTGVKTTPCPPGFFIQWQPYGLFNAMIAPLLRYAIQGVIWYQGESNDKNPDDYEALFLTMIPDWRKRKGQGDIPFLFVQLPLWGKPAENSADSKWALIRAAQSAALRLPATGMAVALDLGEWNDLHPLNKKDVGARLALAAEGVPPGPMLHHIERNSNTVTLSFDTGGGDLVIRDRNAESLSPPEQTDAAVFVSCVSNDGKHTRLPAALVSPNQITVDIRPALTPLDPASPLEMLYAWADNPQDRQLYNTAGLPAIPFKIAVPKTDTVNHS
ncbi:9-O-acetylesterase [Spirochaetia bacterium]|nr:9-O-acetylesterase [Spirochaetia bacterium]